MQTGSPGRLGVDAPRTRPFLFLERFLKDPGNVASVWPSSVRLARAMLRSLDVGPEDLVLEYGPGTGAFTRRLGPLVTTAGSRYLGIEREAAFCRHLEQAYPGLRFVQTQVEDELARLCEAGERGVGAVVSGLPLIAMPHPVMDAILERTALLLRPGGVFRTFSYLHSWPLPGAVRLRRRMREVFDEARISARVVGNLPPAVVLEGRRRSEGVDGSVPRT